MIQSLFASSRMAFLILFPYFLFLSAQMGDFLSQNFFYHTRFALTLISGDFNYSSLEILKSSMFQNGYVDQHYGFHLILAFLNLLFDPKMSVQILTSLCLALTFSLPLKLVKEKDRFLLLALAVFFVGFCLADLNRVFWGRPMILSLLSLSLFARLWLVDAKKWTPLLVMLAGLLMGMASFETLVVSILSVGCLSLIKFNKNLLAVSLIGLGVSLYLPTFNFDKIIYLVDLLKFNLSPNNVIGEWRSVRDVNPFYLSMCAMFLISLTQFKSIYKENKAYFYFTLVAILFFLISIKHLRFLPFFITSVTLSGLFVIAHFLNQMTSKIKLAFPILVVTFGLILAWTGRSSIIADESTNYSTKKFSDWYKNSQLNGKKIINYKWEYWSSLFYYNPKLVTEPGMSTFIYNNNANFVATYEKIRNQPLNITYQDWDTFFNFLNSNFLLIEKTASIVAELDTQKWPFILVYEDDSFKLYEFVRPKISYLEYENNKIKVGNCINSNADCDKLVFIDPSPNHKVGMFPISIEQFRIGKLKESKGIVSYQNLSTKQWLTADQVLINGVNVSTDQDWIPFWTYPYFKRNNKWVFIERFHPDQPIDLFIQQLDQFYLASTKKLKRIYYDYDQPFQSSGIPQTRIFLGMYYYCFINKADCQKYIKKVQNLDSLDLGALAILGLATRKSDGLLELKENIKNRVLQFYDIKRSAWIDINHSSLPIINGSKYMFHVGEALTFLNSQFTWQELPWLKDETEKYMNQFLKEKNAFFVRWASSLLFFAFEKSPNYKESISKSINQLLDIVDQNLIYNHSYPSDLNGCYIDNNFFAQSEALDHRSGLLLEGLAHFTNHNLVSQLPIFKKIVSGLSKCASRVQLHQKNAFFYKASNDLIGGVFMRPSSFKFQVDVLAHLGIAFHLLAGAKP